MANYKEGVLSHKINSTIISLQEKLSELSKLEVQPQLISIFDCKTRIEFILNNYEKSIKNFLTKKVLTDLDNQFSAMINGLSSFIGNQNEVYITQIDGYIDTCLALVPQLFNEKTTANALAKTLTAINENYNSEYNSFLAKVKNLQSQLDKLKTDSEKTDTEYKQNVNQQLQNIKTEITAEKTRIDNLITTGQADIKKVITTGQTDIEKQKNDTSLIAKQLQATYDTLIDNLKKQITAIEEKAEITNSENITKNDTLIEKYKKSFQEELQKCEKITGLIAEKGQSHGYEVFAEASKKSRNIWQIFTVALLVGLIAFSLVFFVFIENNGWVELVAKIVTSSAILTAATYTAKQGAKRDRMYKKAKMLSLELATLDGYLNNFDNVEQKAKLREKLAEKYFGNDIDAKPQADDNEIINMQADAVQKIVSGIVAGIVDELKSIKK